MNVGIIGDKHAPCTRPGYINFCYDTFKQYKVDQIVDIGDIIDWHGISFHARQPDGPGVRDEFEMAYKEVQKWKKLFPKLKWCIGNHDERPARLAAASNIPEFMLKPYNEVWDVPGWEMDFKFTVDEVLYKHGTNCSGLHPAYNQMNKHKMSVVMGHCHSRAGTKWSMNPLKRYFAMDVGCGINEKEYAFAYGRDMVERPILACGVVLDGQPISIAMRCGRGEKYHDSRFVKPGTKRKIFIGKYGKPDAIKTKKLIRHYEVKVNKNTFEAACKCEGEWSGSNHKADVTCGNCKRTKIFKEN